MLFKYRVMYILYMISGFQFEKDLDKNAVLVTLNFIMRVGWKLVGQTFLGLLNVKKQRTTDISRNHSDQNILILLRTCM